MSDDTFIREVNEEMRQERVHAIWRRFGKLIVGLVILVVVATIGFVVWERYRAAQAAADGDRYFAAVDLAESGDLEAAQAAFEELSADGVGAYPHLARLRAAAALAAAGDTAEALDELDAVAASSAPSGLRDVAAVRAAYLLVDTGTPDDVRERVERLTNEAEPLRHPAREALGLALWKAGEGEAARGFFEQITEDMSAPAGIAQRAGLMLELISSGSTAPDAGSGAASATDAPSSPSVEAPATQTPDAQTPDTTLTTPLAEQLDLPAATSGAGEGEPAADPSAASSADTAAEPAPSPDASSEPAPSADPVPGEAPPS